MATDNMLQECLLKTREVSVQWKELGVLLNIKKYLLDQIERNYPRDVATCRMEMLHAWLKSNPVNPEAVLGDALKDILKTTYDSKSKAFYRYTKHDEPIHAMQHVITFLANRQSKS